MQGVPFSGEEGGGEGGSHNQGSTKSGAPAFWKYLETNLTGSWEGCLVRARFQGGSVAALESFFPCKLCVFSMLHARNHRC